MIAALKNNRAISFAAAAFAVGICVAVLTGAFPSVALAEGTTSIFGFNVPSWLGWGIPAIISVGLGVAALAIFIIAKAQGSWDQGGGSKKRRGQRRRY
jgi:hypothetical protein